MTNQQGTQIKSMGRSSWGKVPQTRLVSGLMEREQFIWRSYVSECRAYKVIFFPSGSWGFGTLVLQEQWKQRCCLSFKLYVLTELDRPLIKVAVEGYQKHRASGVKLTADSAMTLLNHNAGTLKPSTALNLYVCVYFKLAPKVTTLLSFNSILMVVRGCHSSPSKKAKWAIWYEQVA